MLNNLVVKFSLFALVIFTYLHGLLLPEFNTHFVILYMFASFFVAIKLKFLKDFKKPCTLFFFMYFFFLVIGMIPYSLLYEIDNRLLKLIFIGIFSFLLGYTFSFNSNKPQFVLKKNYPNHLTPLLYIFLISTGLLGLIFFYYQVGVIPLFNQEMLVNRAEILQGKGVGLQLFRFTVIPLYILFAEQIVRRKHSFSIYFLLSIVVFGFMTIGYRSPIFEILLSFLLLYYYLLNKTLKLKTLFIVGILFLLFAIIFSIIRESRNFLFEALLTIYVNILNFSYILKQFPENVQFQYGTTYFLNFLIIRPGPDKDFTMWLRDQLNVTSTMAVTPSIVGEWYLNFGYLGIVIGMFLMGILSNIIEKKLKNSSNIFSTVKWILIFNAFLKTVTGGISNVFFYLILNLILLEFVKLVAKIRFFREVKHDKP